MRSAVVALLLALFSRVVVEHQHRAGGEADHALGDAADEQAVEARELELHYQPQRHAGSGQLAGMEIRDNLDQLLIITFSDVDSSPGLKPSDFAFEPPEGADLFYHDQ